MRIAEADIREAFLWYRERSPLAADGLGSEVFEAIDDLAETGASVRRFSGLSAQDQMRGGGGRDVFGTAITKPNNVQACEEMLAGAEQDRRDGQMQLVDQAGLQILSDRIDAAAQPHVLAARSLARQASLPKPAGYPLAGLCDRLPGAESTRPHHLTYGWLATFCPPAATTFSRGSSSDIGRCRLHDSRAGCR